jgi:putative membrane protein
MNFIISWVASAISVAAAVAIVPGIQPVGADSTMAIIMMALALSLVNASIKPIAQALSLPLTVLTLGIFYLVMNALLLELAAWLSTTILGSGVTVASFGSAFFGSIVISIVNSIVDSIIGKENNK